MKRFEIRIPRTLKINLMEEVINFLSFNGAEEYLKKSEHIIRYKEIEYFGHLDGCINELLRYKAKGELVSINFNGHMLYSDTITVDGAYQEVLGVTKAEREMFDRIIKNIKKRKGNLLS